MTKTDKRSISVRLGRDTLAALDRLKTAHGTRQAAIEHAIRQADTPRYIATNAPTVLHNYREAPLITLNEVGRQ